MFWGKAVNCKYNGYLITTASKMNYVESVLR